MKKNLTSIVVAVVAILAISFTSCKSKNSDANIKAAVEKALAADSMSVGMTVSVDKGVVTINGVAKDQMCSMHCIEVAKAVKGVEKVIDNCTVATPTPPASSDAAMVNPANDELTKNLTDALKDFPTVKSAIANGKIVLTGEISKVKWNILKPLLDKFNKTMGYDFTGLTITK
jgi:hyperosmotically inducible periplasmic protein